MPSRPREFIAGGGMYLRCNRRLKDGKEHRYWNIVESKRCDGGKVVQRNVLNLGEINDSQRDHGAQDYALVGKNALYSCLDRLLADQIQIKAVAPFAGRVG
jgi:hypothetical protein